MKRSWPTLPSWATTRPRPTALVLTVLVLVTAILVVRARGYETPEPDLHDGGIWVTNETRRVVGRTNAEIAIVDTKIDAGTGAFELHQAGDLVVVHQQDPPALAAIDPALASLVPGPEVPDGTQIGLGDHTAALLDPDGALLVRTVRTSTGVLGLDPASPDAEPVAEIEGDALLTVGTDGLVHVLAVETGEITTWDGDGRETGTGTIDAELDRPVLSTVGDRPVVLDHDVLHVPGHDPVTVDVGGGAVLQEPGPAADGILVAGDERLVEVAVGGDVITLGDGGTGGPARPLRVGSCTYAAWGGDPTYQRRCGDDDTTEAIPEMTAGDAVRFRTNHGRVTLNDLTEGSQLLFGDGDPIFIEADWAEALSDEIEIDPEADDETDDEAEATCENRDNRPPTANDDLGVFGTRRGRPVVIHPLRNDTDPDCDVLLVDDVEPTDPDRGTVGIVDGGRAVQVEVADDADRFEFTYRVTDGRGGSDTAKADVTVIDDEVNEPPVLTAQETTVVTGGTVTHNVLATAFDPDGDVLRLEGAEEAGTATGTLRTTPRGDITFTAGNTTGEIPISYVVGDGRGAEQTEVLTVTVVEHDENHPPVARNDTGRTFVGRETTVDVLSNDTDPNGDQLSIVRATTDDDADIRWDTTSGDIRVRADQPGTVNVHYRITDGRETDEAVLRVDVRERGEKQSPTAVRDEVFVTGGEPAFVPVLDNDVDPDGEVLVILGINDLPDPAPFAVSVIDRSMLKITADTDLDGPTEFGYRISNGTRTADGRVIVEPPPTDRENRPPIAVPDEYTVRAGGIVTLPVLDNDSDPDGDPIEIVEPDEDQGDIGRNGRLFLGHDHQLRYEAPDNPRASVRLVYSITDSVGNLASAELTLHVIGDDGDTNNPPIAPELTGRTVSGQDVAIPIPTGTMDPDGDAVTLLGIDEPPEHGSIADVDTDTIVYSPDRDFAGTDEFTYRVADQWGAEASGTVLVGVAGRAGENNRPVAVDDDIRVRPGTTVRIPVLENDFDPDGDPLTIVDEDDDRPAPATGSAEIDDRHVRYTAPERPDVDQTAFRYTVDDGRGGRASATITVVFGDGDDNRPPIAIDDILEPQEPETLLRIPVLDNDQDPDHDELEVVETSHPDAVVDPETGEIHVEMPDRPLQFTYLVTDGTDTARAAVIVPVLEPDTNRAPVAEPDEADVDMGDSVTIDVLANDTDPDGDDLHLLKLKGVRHGTARIEDDRVVFTASEDRYVGDAGFSYVVGDDPDPTVAATSTAAVHVTIHGDLNTPPRFTDLDLELGQGDSRRIDLTTAIDDPDPDDTHDIEITDVDGPVRADLDGDVITVEASLDAEPGETATVEVHVDDGTDDVTGTVTVRITGSQRPLATVGADTAETFEGRPVTIDVLANDTNPFPEEPLRIVRTSDPSGGGGTVVEGAGGLRYEPADGFFGTTNFTYTVADATDDPDRQVTGTVTVTVIGRPSPPPAPTCIGGESGSVRVQWSTPSANGAGISGYVVRVTGDGAGTGTRDLGNATTQDVDGLTNGADYRFEVGAVNAAVEETGGEPVFSDPSPTCTPDEVPGRPEPPRTTFGDGELDITWTPPPNDGSPIERLILTNTTSGESKTFGPTITDHTWTGLENGTSARFTLTAENALGAGPTSPQSTGDSVPAGVPGRPAAPEVTATVGARDGFLDVDWTWSSSKDNGDPIDRFRIVVERDGEVDDEIVVEDPSARSQTFSTDNGVPYRFTIEAHNKAGWSEISKRSAKAVSAGKPLGRPTVSATEGDTQTILTVGGKVDDNGAPIDGHEYDVNGSGNWKTLGSDGRITGLDNGKDHTFRVRARNSEGAGEASAASNTVNPYGRPGTPNVTASVSDRTITWTWNAPDGNGRSIDHYEHSLDGGAWKTTTGRKFSDTFGHSEKHTLRVRAVTTASDADRRTGDAGSASKTTADAPEPSVGTIRLGNTECDTHPGSQCTAYNVKGENLAKNATVKYACQFREKGSSWMEEQFERTGSTNGSGTFEGNASCHVGVNMELRYVVRVGGETLRTKPVTKK